MTFTPTRSSSRSWNRSWSRLAVLVVPLSFALHCDRAIEPFDPEQEPQQPDLARIFPPGSEPGQAPPMAPGVQRGDGPMRGTMPAAPQAPSGAPDGAPAEPIRGRIEIADSLQGTAPQQAVLFLIARKQATGPPLAVLRIPSPSFPLEFELGQANVMIPSLRFEGEMTLSARLDSDGNARTKLPGDLEGSIEEPLSAGASGVVLTLDGQL